MKVGIALAAFQPDPLIFAEQLESIRTQTYRNWICNICSDSPLAEYAAHPALADFRADERFIWSENPVRLGHKANFERAIQQLAAMKVDAIGCADQDDLWYPEKMTTTVEALRGSGPLSLVHSDMHSLKDGRIAPRTVWELEERGVRNVRTGDLLIRNVVAGCAMLFDVELARRFPRIPEGVDYHDHWYALVASCHGGVRPINKPLFAYRQHAANVVGTSAFAGVLTVPPGSTARSIAEKCRSCWRKSSRLARAALQEGLQLSRADRLEFIHFFDLGMMLALRGLIRFRGDRPLARATLARAAGKILSLRWMRNFGTSSDNPDATDL